MYGPESREENDKLADIVIARRDAVAKAYGIARKIVDNKVEGPRKLKVPPSTMPP